MRRRYPHPAALPRCLAAAALGLWALVAGAQDPAPMPPLPVPEALRVHGELPSLPGVADLKFRDFFRMPIGPRGLEPSEQLLRLDGRPVRLVGYMARQDDPSAGLFILSPLPVHMGDEDDSYADDLPAAAVFVHLGAGQQATRLPYMPGLLALTGTLQIGASDESDGRVSAVRLLLSDTQSRLLASALSEATAPTAR